MLQMLLVGTLAMSGAQNAPHGALRAGWEAIQRGQADEAAAAFRRALAADGRDPSALARKGGNRGATRPAETTRDGKRRLTVVSADEQGERLGESRAV